MNSTLKIQTPEAITLIEKIKAEIKKARGVKSQTKVAESAQTAGETLMVIFSKAIYVGTQLSQVRIGSCNKPGNFLFNQSQNRLFRV